MKIINDLIIALTIGIFIFVNIKIAYEDYRFKKIRNKYLLVLLLLLPFFYTYFSLPINPVVISYCALTFILVIVLYLTETIPPGDAKYILVLSLFIGQGTPVFFGFIGFVILLKILFNYLYFLVVKWRKVLDSFYKNKALHFSGILGTLSSFVFFFLISNLISLYVGMNYSVVFAVTEYKIMYFFSIMLVFFSINRIFSSFLRRMSFKENSPRLLSLIKYGCILLLLVVNGYFLNKGIIKFTYIDIGKMFLFFLIINFFIKSFILMFRQNEEKIIPINDLSVGDVVDKKFLYHIFGQYSDISNYLVENGAIRGKGFFEKIENPINMETRDRIVSIYNLINEKNRLENNNYSFLDTIKVFHTFGFGVYIFSAFMLYVAYFIYR